MKLKALLATVWLSASGAGWCAPPAGDIDARFLTRDDTLALKISNRRKDVPVHIGDLRLRLPAPPGQPQQGMTYRTAADMDIEPGHDATVSLLPVKQLATAMQQRGEAPRSGYSRILVDNRPDACSSCAADASYQFKSIGFDVQADASVNGDAIETPPAFDGYLVFLFQ